LARRTLYSYDINGNLMTKSGEATYTWDFENRLVKVQKVDGTLIQYVYDVDGNRVHTTTTPPGGAPQLANYLVDTSGSLSEVVAEANAAGQVTAYYLGASPRKQERDGSRFEVVSVPAVTSL
jgi:YD repeat-containing protein